MAKLDHVTARFGGAQRVFRYPRQPGGITHYAVMSDGFSPYACFQRLSAGAWTILDLLRVLSPLQPGEIVYVPDREIAAAIELGGPGNYAPLAARVLQAALFGIEAKDARWDERKPFALPDDPEMKGAA